MLVGDNNANEKKLRGGIQPDGDGGWGCQGGALRGRRGRGGAWPELSQQAAVSD